MTVFVDHYPNAIFPIYERMNGMGFDVQLVKPVRRIRLTRFLQLGWRAKVVSKAHLYIVTVRSRSLTPPHKSALLLHGIGLEEISTFDEQYKAVFVTGPAMMDAYKNAFAKKHWHKFIPVGFPPLEKMLSREIREKARLLKEKLSLENRPTILFGVLAETNEIESNIISKALTVLEDTADKQDVNIIIKPHQFFKVWGPGFNHNRYDNLKKKLQNKTHIHILSPEEDIMPLYHISDVLISGRCSSIITEFMTLDKPTIQVVSDNVSEQIFFDVGLRCDTKNLAESIKRSLENPNEFSEERKKWVRKNVYNPEGTIERAIEAIKNLQ